jgi:ketosteroid isomerase-like protein
MPITDPLSIICEAFEALNRRDVEHLLFLCNEEVEFESVLAASEGKAYRGSEGGREYVEDLEDAWADFRSEPERFIHGADAILSVVRSVGRGRVSGVPVDVRTAVIWTVREGKIRRGVAYLDPSEALEALDARSRGRFPAGARRTPFGGRESTAISGRCDRRSK